MIECNASKDFVNSLICDWFCVVSFYETGIFSSVHMDNAEADCFIAEKKKFTGIELKKISKRKIRIKWVSADGGYNAWAVKQISLNL